MPPRDLSDAEKVALFPRAIELLADVLEKRSIKYDLDQLRTSVSNARHFLDGLKEQPKPEADDWLQPPPAISGGRT